MRELFRGRIFFLLLIVLVFAASCSNSVNTKKEMMEELKASGENIDDIARWFVLASLRDPAVKDASFVLNSKERSVYVLIRSEYLNAGYPCSEDSKYCSLCIDLKTLSLKCPASRSDALDVEGSLVLNNEPVSIKTVALYDRGVRAKKLVFSGTPARFIYNGTGLSKFSSTDKKDNYKFSRGAECPDVLGRERDGVVICNAVVDLSKI